MYAKSQKVDQDMNIVELTPATLCTALNAVMSESDASAAISGARPSGCQR